jgi:ABC-type amino acid transport substrate-binding protein
MVLGAVPPPEAATSKPALDRIRSAARIRLGYRTDARPFSFQDETGRAAGYSVALCQVVAAAIQQRPGLSAITIEWVPVTATDRLEMIKEGRIDLLCGAVTATLARRSQVAFSLPIFAGGIGALIRTDAHPELRELLAGRLQTSHQVWRDAAAKVLQARAFAAVQGTTADTWLAASIQDFKAGAEIARVGGYEAGVQGVLDRKADAFFGERAVLLDTAQRHVQAADLALVDRMFTYEPLALALGRNDDDFRLVVDRVLSRLYGSGEIRAIYTRTFGAPDEQMLTFLRWHTLPE